MFGSLTLLLALALAIAAILTSQAPLLILAVAMLLAIGASKLWDRYCLAGLEFCRKLDRTLYAFGDTLDLQVEVINRKVLPLAWVELEDEVPRDLPPKQGIVYPSHKANRLNLGANLALRPYERVRKHYKLSCLHRGEYELGPGRLRTGDLFGIVSRSVELREGTRFVVLPRVVPLERLGLPAQQPLGEVRTQSWIYDDPSRIAGVREYRPGDSLRRIHWSATARTQQLQSRVYEATTGQKLALFLNLHTIPGVVWGLDYDEDVLEFSIMTAASIASWADDMGYGMGLFANGWKMKSGLAYVSIRPSAGAHNLGTILEALGRLQPSAVIPFERLLRLEESKLDYGTTIVVVSGVVSDSLAEALRTLRSKGFAVVLVYTGKREIGLMLGGMPVRRVGPVESWKDIEAIESVVS